MSTDTTERALRVLGLLQARPGWTAPELARDLGVTTRTVRRDVDRLRQLGSAIDAGSSAPDSANVTSVMGYVMWISLGIANSAMTISMRPVRTARRPVPSSENTSVPTSWNAAAYTMAAAGL